METSASALRTRLRPLRAAFGAAFHEVSFPLSLIPPFRSFAVALYHTAANMLIIPQQT
jgi:hypothetical protein